MHDTKFFWMKHVQGINPKGGGGDQNDPLGTDKACMPSIFIKNSQIVFWWKLLDVSFHQIFFWEVEDDRNRP